MSAVLALALLLAPPADTTRDGALAAALERCFPGDFDLARDGPPLGDRLLWQDALAGPGFASAAVGPLDVHVYLADGWAQDKDARAELERAQRGLQPAADLVARRFDRPSGLLSGRRIPVVLASSAKGGTGWDELLALLDWCERDASGWKQDNGPLWTPALRAAARARTWEVLLLNAGHADLQKLGADWHAHGLGYELLAHLTHGLLRQGAWGAMPPWVDQGLLDELDIEAHGQAFVGGDWYQTHTDGWYREGWSGFLPEGMAPPTPVTGPPADLATSVRNVGDSWAHRAHSIERHWSHLRADVEQPWPPSLAFMTEHQSFLPRDRAFARCVWWLLLDLAPPPGAGVLERLDHPRETLPGGMFTAEPISSLLSAELGGVPEVDVLARQPLRDKLPTLGHAEIASRLVTLGAEGVLAESDHRQAGEWLHAQPQFGEQERSEIFKLLLTAEHFEQEQAFRSLAQALDRATHAALRAAEHPPQTARERADVAQAFRGALAP